MSARSGAPSLAYESTISTHEESDHVNDFLQWLRSLSLVQKVLVRKYLANEKVDDQEEDWNLRMDYVERCVKIPDDALRRIRVAMGVVSEVCGVVPPHISQSESQDSQQALATTPADQRPGELGEQEMTADSVTSDLLHPEGNAEISNEAMAMMASNNRMTESGRDSKSGAPQETSHSAKQTRVLFPDTFDHSADDEALVEVCSLMNEIIGEVGTFDDSSQSERDPNELRKSRIIIAALRVMRANFKLPRQSGKTGLAKRLEPALRELVINYRCCNLLSAAASAQVRDAALETYDVGMEIFFSSPMVILQALMQMLQHVDAGQDSQEKHMCSRCESVRYHRVRVLVCMCMCACVRAHLFTYCMAVYAVRRMDV
jgi:hypothetical protein